MITKYSTLQKQSGRVKELYLATEDVWNFFKKTPELPYQEELLKNPEYHAEYKNKKAEIVFMSPKQYFIEAAKNRQPPIPVWQEIDAVEETLVNKYYQRVLQENSKMPLPSIDRITGAQEGRHRAVVAKRLGLSVIPVLIVDYVRKPEETLQRYSQLKSASSG